MKYKAVIFDLDGTLIDSMGIWIQIDKEYLEKRNIPVPDDLFKDVKTGNSFNEICQYFKDKFNLPDSIKEIGAEWTDMVAEHYKNEITLKSGAHEFINFLNANNIKMAIGTSNTKYLTKTVLSANGVLGFFESIVAGCEDIKGKPYPDIFLKAAKELNITPKECLVIEDTLHGVLAAHNANMDVFGIFDDNETHDVNAIKKEADFYAGSFIEIMEKFENEK